MTKNDFLLQAMTPSQMVSELDKYVIGQKEAKKAVAIALRNRYRRSRLPEELRDEVTPKNILMIGPTGVGKTEIARRIAKMTGAPFIKVEATKFTEVGYVGRDVDSMIRDLVETGIRTIKAERLEEVSIKAEDQVNERLLEALVPEPVKEKSFANPFDVLFQNKEERKEASDSVKQERARIRQQLLAGELESQIIEIQVEEQSLQGLDFVPGMGAEGLGNLQEMLGNIMPKRRKSRRVTVAEGRKMLRLEEAQKLLDMDEVIADAVSRTEQAGIIFIDEFDKIASKEGRGGAEVSREGVQRDILPIVEGSTVMTKHGPVKTDHILFIAAGAFHMAKPSDLIPELQGRFPIRVELTSLSAEDFEKILTEPEHALLTQYSALLQTEGVGVTFEAQAVRKLAEIATEVNSATEDIGARRLHTLVERLLEELLFASPDIGEKEVVITSNYVEEKLGSIAKDRDLSQYIL